MPTSRRKKAAYHHGDLRPALLLVAADVIEKQGLEELTLRDVARRAGVSHNAPYRHFKDRNALLAALAEDGFHNLGKALEGKQGNEMGEAYVRFALAHPARFRLMFGGVRPGDHPALREASGHAYDALLQAVRARQDLPDPQIAAAAAWSLVHGLANLLLDGHFERAKDDNGGDTDRFIKSVLSRVRFAGAAQRSA